MLTERGFWQLANLKYYLYFNIHVAWNHFFYRDYCMMTKFVIIEDFIIIICFIFFFIFTKVLLKRYYSIWCNFKDINQIGAL